MLIFGAEKKNQKSWAKNEKLKSDCLAGFEKFHLIIKCWAYEIMSDMKELVNYFTRKILSSRE